MTDPADFDPADTALPGLAPARPSDSALSKATRQTIRALDAAGYLDDRAAVLCQLMLDLAEVVDAGRRQGKASAAAMAAAQIVACYERLVPETKGGSEDDEAWSELVAEFRRRTSEIRDAAQPGAPD